MLAEYIKNVTLYRGNAEVIGRIEIHNVIRKDGKTHIVVSGIRKKVPKPPKGRTFGVSWVNYIKEVFRRGGKKNGHH